jgi:hypothetical protein
MTSSLFDDICPWNVGSPSTPPSLTTPAAEIVHVIKPIEPPGGKVFPLLSRNEMSVTPPEPSTSPVARSQPADVPM